MSTSDSSGAYPPGPFAHGSAWLAALLKYLKARAELAKIEAKEAGIHYGIAAGLAVGALVFMMFGYLFLMLTAVFGVAALFEERHAWIAVMGATGLIHFGGALVLVLLARKRLKMEPFPITLEELKKDQTCLTNHANKHS